MVLGLAAALLAAVAGSLLSDAVAFATAPGLVPLFVEATAGLVVPTGFRSATLVGVLSATAAAVVGPFLACAAAPTWTVFLASDAAVAGFLVAPFAAVLVTPLATLF